MAELKNNYSGADFYSLKRDSDDFHAISEEIRVSKSTKKKIKIKMKG
jgi:hypothetical protein